MGEPHRKRRPGDELERIPADAGGADPDKAAQDPLAAVQALQRQAGNAAVSAMMASQSSGSPKAGGGAQSAGRQPGGQKPTGPQAPADTFEAQLFDQSVLDPLRSLYAVLRDTSPDASLALQKLMPIGEALRDYWERYQGRDDAVANMFFAARGWLVPMVDQLRQREGPVKPWSDEQIANRVQETIDDMKVLRNKLG